MAESTLPTTYVEVPPPPVLGGGVLGAARVIPPQTTHQLAGALYLTDACGDGGVWTEISWFPSENPPTKQFAGAPDIVESSTPFAVYSGVQCDLARQEEQAQRARARLDFTERHQIDLQFTQNILPNRAFGVGGPFPLGRAIGMLENFAASVYGGVPVLYIPRTLIPEATQQGMITPSLNGGLVTAQGSVVANVDVDPFTSPLTIWASGAVTLIQGPLIEVVTPPGFNPDLTNANDARALAERLYVPLIECFVAQATICDGECTDTGGTAPAAPTATILTPNTASIANTPEFDLVVNGTNFTPGCVILFNNAPQPTQFLGTGALSCRVDPSTAFQPITVPVAVRCGDQTTAPLNFTFTA